MSGDVGDGETGEPSEVTYVLAIEILGTYHVETLEKFVIPGIRDVMRKLGVVDGIHYEISHGEPTDMLKGKPVTDKPSASQVGYLRRLYGDLERMMLHATGKEVDPGVMEVAQMVKETILEEMRDQAAVSKRRMSQLIDAAKESVGDIQAELSGI